MALTNNYSPSFESVTKMWHLMLYIAYMSIVLNILCCQEMMSQSAQQLNTYTTFPDGLYYIYSDHSQKAVDCSDDTLKSADRDGKPHQKFKFEKYNSDWYHIKCKSRSSKCIGIGSTTWFSSQRYITSDSNCNTNDNQLFKFAMTSDGYAIESKDSGLVWEVKSSNDLKGNTAHYRDNQIFRIISDEAVVNWDQQKHYFIYSVHSGLAIDCAKGSDHVQQYTRNGGQNQKIRIQWRVRYPDPQSDYFEIHCSDSDECWEKTWWNNIIHTKCDDSDKQHFRFRQRPNGIAIINMEGDGTIVFVPDLSTESGMQLKAKDKRNFDGDQLFRITENAITPETFDACKAISSTPTSTIRSDWMQHIPKDVYIHRVSIPGTHETMGAKGIDCSITCKNVQTQDLTLSEQLNDGIRALDIRLRIITTPSRSQYFQVWHGEDNRFRHNFDYDLGHSFEDVLNVIQDFLQHHQTEFILMRVEREWKKTDNPTLFLSIFDDYYYKKYPNLFWKPPSNHNYIPKVSEVIQQVVVLQGFHTTKYYGLKYKPQPQQQSWDLFYHTQDGYDLKGRDKYVEIKNMLINANNNGGSNTEFYVNYFSSTGGAIPHPFAASCFYGDHDFLSPSILYGANAKAYDYISDNINHMTFVGIIYMDFPGQVLIDRIIKINPWLSSIAFPIPAKQGILKWITDVINDKTNNNDNIRVLFDKSALVLFAVIILLMVSNIYCICMYCIQIKAKKKRYYLVSTQSDTDIEE